MGEAFTTLIKLFGLDAVRNLILAIILIVLVVAFQYTVDQRQNDLLNEHQSTLRRISQNLDSASRILERLTEKVNNIDNKGTDAFWRYLDRRDQREQSSSTIPRGTNPMQ